MKQDSKWKWLVVFPFVVGYVGYRTGGLGIAESMYAALALYFVNPVSEATNHLITVAKFSGFLVAASVVAALFVRVFGLFAHVFADIHKDSTAIFTDNQAGEILASNLKHSYLGYVNRKKHSFDRAQSFVVMYTNDVDNLAFYESNKAKLERKNVYIQLNNTDMNMLSAADSPFVHFFNVYDLIARLYWQKFNFYDQMKSSPSYSVAIIGGGRVAQAIFDTAYLTNLYRNDQTIEYHLWNVSDAQAAALKKLKTMNSDRVIINSCSWEDDVNNLASYDRIIVADGIDSYQALQTILKLFPDKEVHCYSDADINFGDIFNHQKLCTFGRLSSVLNDQYIRNEKHVRNAKLINYDYVLRCDNRSFSASWEQESDTEWNKLNGFNKGANIAKADHLWIDRRLKSDGMTGKDARRLEHTRWCRYYLINHWEYAPKRDNDRHKHNLLVPYEELSTKETEKDSFYSPEIEHLITMNL